MAVAAILKGRSSSPDGLVMYESDWAAFDVYESGYEVPADIADKIYEIAPVESPLSAYAKL